MCLETFRMQLLGTYRKIPAGSLFETAESGELRLADEGFSKGRLRGIMHSPSLSSW